MRYTLELYWLHLAGTNPTESFWEELGLIPHVEIVRETESEQGAKALLARLLETPNPVGVQRLAFLHIRDLEEYYDGDPRNAGREHPGFLTILFSKGDADYHSEPPVLHYSRDVLPYLEGELLPLLRTATASNLVQALETWRRSTAELFGVRQTTDRTVTFTGAESRMITSQIHSASGRISSVMRRMERAKNEEESRELIVRSLKEAQEFLSAAEHVLNSK